MRITRLTVDNRRTQGAERRTWYRRHSPEHLNAVSALVENALRLDGLASTRQTVVLGAGACTEIPLERLARASAHVSLVDLDVAGMAQARDELPATVRDRVDLLQADLTDGVSEALAAELRATPFADLNMLDQGRGMREPSGGRRRLPGALPRSQMRQRLRVFEPGGYDLVVSDFVLTQLYSLPLLDVVGTLTAYAPAVADLRETLPRYQDRGERLPATSRAGAPRAAAGSTGARWGGAAAERPRGGAIAAEGGATHARDPVERAGDAAERARWRSPATWSATIRLPRQHGRGAG